jgi:hypothetical protein
MSEGLLDQPEDRSPPAEGQTMGDVLVRVESGQRCLPIRRGRRAEEEEVPPESFGAKEDLVERPRDWPGVHAVLALVEGEILEGL